MDISLVPIIIAAGGVAIIAWIYFWSRQQGQLGQIPTIEEPPQELTLAANEDAILVSTERGQVIYANESARRWLGMNGGDPDLEYIVQLAQPADSLLELFAVEGQASFQLGKRWVEASSHLVPAGNERRMVIRMRELSAAASHPEALNLNAAMAVINEIGQTANASMGIEQVLQILLTIVSKVVPADAGEICLWEEKEQALYQRGWIGDTSYLLAMAELGGIYHQDEGLPGWMAHYRKPVLLTRSDDTGALNPSITYNPFNSVVGVPLVLGERFIGTFELFSQERERFTQADMALLQAVSTPIAVSIYNAQLYGEQVQRVHDIASLQQISQSTPGALDEAAPIYRALNERIATLIGAEMCGVFVYIEDREGLAPEPPFHGLPDHVARGLFIPVPPGSPQYDIWKNQPYWVSNELAGEELVGALGLRPLIDVAGVYNTALMPLAIGGERIGILALFNKRAEGGFTPRDIQNLRVLSAQTAIVVENVRLSQRERRLDTELVGLQEITHAIGALSHEGEFYSEITERIARLTNIAMCGILLYDDERQCLKAQLPFFGVSSDLIADYRIDLQPGSVVYDLWNEEEYWFTNNVRSNSLVFEAGLDELAEKTGVLKTLIAVLSAGGRRLGAVQASNKLNGEDFTENDARLLLIFATQAAAIIENARLYREVQRSAEQAQALRRIAELAGEVLTTEETFTPVLAETARLTDSALVFINVLDQQTGSLITYPRWAFGVELTEPIVQDIYSPGFHHSVAVSHEPFFSNDVPNHTPILPGYKALAARFNITKAILAPLVVGDRSLGELGIANRADGDYTEEDLGVLHTVAAQIAAALDRLLRYQATGQNLIRRNEELDAVSRVSNELTLTLDLDRILDVIRTEAARAAKAEGSTVALLQPISEWRTPDQPEMERRIGEVGLMPRLAPIELEAISRGADTVLVTDYEHHDLEALPPQARSALAAAIMYVDQVVGVIHLFHSEPNRFDHQAAAFLMTLSTKAALGYGNAIRFQEQVERSAGLRRRVEQLNQIFELGHVLQANTDPAAILESIAYGVQQGVGFDTVLMLLADEKAGVLRRMAHAGLPIDVFEQTRSRTFPLSQVERLFKEDYRTSQSYFFPMEKVSDWFVDGMAALSTSFEGSRTTESRGRHVWREGDMLLVRLNASNGSLLGMMSLDRPHTNRRPDRNDIEVLEIFAHQAAQTLENTRLYLTTARSAEQEARLNEMMEAIALTLDVDEIVEAMVRGALRLAPFDHMTVALQDVQRLGFDVLSVTVDADQKLDTTREHRDTLEHTALGSTFTGGFDSLYRTGHEDVEFFVDLRAAYEGGEQISLLLPLMTGGECLGAIHIGSDRPDVEALVEYRSLLKRMAQLVASAIQNARLFDQAVNLQALNQSVVMSIQQGIVVLDSARRIISINDSMRQRYGWDNSALRQELFTYRPDYAGFLTDDLQRLFETATPQERIGQRLTDLEGNPLITNFYIYPLRSEDVVRGAVLLVEDVTERSQLEQAVEARANQLAALTEVSTRITSSLEREEVIQVALSEMGKIIPYDAMLLWRRSGAFMGLEGAAGVADATLAAQGIRVKFELIDRMRQVVETQRVICVHDPDGLKEQLPGEEGVQSWMGVPLVSQGNVVGMVVLVKYEPGHYTSISEQQVAFTFASQVAIALANADLFEQTFERTNELGTLLEASQATAQTRDLDEVFRTVVELMFSALDMDDCAIMLWNEIENVLEVQVDMNRQGDASRMMPTGTRYNLAEYPAKQQALRSREVVVIYASDEEKLKATAERKGTGELRPPGGRKGTGELKLPGERKGTGELKSTAELRAVDDLRTTAEITELRAVGDFARMLIPLVVSDQAIGLIQLEQHGEREIPQQRIRLARALGTQVAIAIDNARLSTETTNQFEELLVINELSRTISGTLKLDDMLRIIREQVPRVVEARELYLALYNPDTQDITFPMAVREGKEFIIPARKLNTDEVSFIIRYRQILSLGADYYGLDEMRRNLGITNGEGDIKSYMGLPLIVGDQVLGALAVRDTQRTRAFTLNDRRILTTIGSQLAAAIQNVRLFEQIQNFAEDLNRVVEERTYQLEQERDRIDTLYHITSELAQTLDMDRLLSRALGMVANAVKADDGAIMRIDPLTDTLYSQAVLNPQSPQDGGLKPTAIPGDGQHPHHPAEELAAWLIENEQVVVVEDLHQAPYWDKDAPGASEWRSALGVVLETNEDIQGVMVLLSRQVGMFTEDQLRLLAAAASQVAAAINNADLYGLIRDQAERLGTLLRAEQEEAEKSRAILEGIADGVILADADGVVILFNPAAERIFQLSRDEVLGQQLSRMTGMYGGAASAWVRAIEGWANRDWSGSQADDGQFLDERLELGDRVVSVHVSPVHIGENFLGTVSVFRDISKDVEVERMKSEFVSNVSHELRTPLTPIKGYTDLLLAGAVGRVSKQQADALKKIKDNVTRLHSLVEDVLDISTIDSGRERLRVSQVDAQETVATVVAELKAHHEHKNITVTVTGDDDLPVIYADADKLTEIVRNLVDNAFNYTFPNGKIDISIEREPDLRHILIAVTDTGVGIPEDFRDAIWQRFQRYEEHALMMDVAGTGLGLPIVKELVAMHHGEVWFDSELGKGTTFYVRLPIEQPQYVTTTAELARAIARTTKE